LFICGDESLNISKESLQVQENHPSRHEGIIVQSRFKWSIFKCTSGCS